MAEASETSQKSAPTSARDAIVSALLELAGERHWEDIPISDIAARANVSLSTFREFFPSKGAVLAAFMRKIDKIVLDGSPPKTDQASKDRLFEVLLHRLDALKPYRPGLESISEWSSRDPFGAAALNREMVNSMRFMLEAAGIDFGRPHRRRQIAGSRLRLAARADDLVHRRQPRPGRDESGARSRAHARQFGAGARRGRGPADRAFVLDRPLVSRSSPLEPARDRRGREHADGFLNTFLLHRLCPKTAAHFSGRCFKPL